MKMSKIRIEGHLYDTTKLDEKIKTYDFDETTSVNSLLELINEQADEIISLRTKCSALELNLKKLIQFDPVDEMIKESDWNNDELVSSAVNKVKKTIN